MSEYDEGRKAYHNGERYDHCKGAMWQLGWEDAQGWQFMGRLVDHNPDYARLEARVVGHFQHLR